MTREQIWRAICNGCGARAVVETPSGTPEGWRSFVDQRSDVFADRIIDLCPEHGRLVDYLDAIR